MSITAAAQGRFSVRFEESVYSIAPGGSLPVSVVMEGVPGSGIYSYGVEVKFDPGVALLEVLGITPAAGLDYNGVMGPGALKSVGEGVGSVKGTVNIGVQPLEAYHGTLIATFLIKDRSGLAGGSYPIGLSIDRTLGAAESVFIDGGGGVLDGEVEFSGAVIRVVPEPGVMSLVGLGAGGSWVLRRRGQRRSHDYLAVKQAKQE